MSTTKLKERKIIIDLIKSIKSRACVEDPNNQFYGKVTYEVSKTNDFYHADYHDAQRKKSAKFECDQVRTKSVGSTGYAKKYQSIMSIGIDDEVVSIQNFSGHTDFQATTLDGNSRIIISEDVEEKTEEEIDVIHFIITDKKLVQLISRKKKFFQNKLNDHLPHSNSDPEEIKQYIRDEIASNSNPDAKSFKSALIDEVYEMVSNSRTRSTVSGWVTQIYKEQARAAAGIICWEVQNRRHLKVRDLLESAGIPDIKGNWESDAGLAHKKYIIHSKSTTGSNIEKDLGTIMVKREHEAETRKAICVFFTVAANEKSVNEAQLKTFKKLEAVEKKYNFYDYTYALGQIKNSDAGTLLTKSHVLQAKKKLENVIQISAAK
tara:strand:- start:46 stop:1176 length:1131 start_codon:yes stop_codon:yes gene_type:complete